MKKEVLLPMSIVVTLISVSFMMGGRISTLEEKIQDQQKNFTDFRDDFKQTGRDLVQELRKLNDKVIVLETTTNRVEERSKKIQKRVE